ncbi:MAG: SGNH/GDSL hydrolase family protein [Planctomycetota bacterium]
MTDAAQITDRRAPRAAPRPSRRRWLALVAALVLSPVVAEGALRIAGAEGVVLHRQEGRLLQKAEPPLPHRPLPDATATVEYRRRSGALVRRTRMSVNPEGYRGPLAGDGRPRVVCVGDSHTYGWGVDDDAPWPRVLERRLREAGRPDAEVLNLGVGGFAADAELEWLRREGLPRDPDVVLWQWFVNDLRLRDEGAERSAPQRSLAHWTSPWIGGWIGELRRVSRVADLGLQAIHARLVQTRGHFAHAAGSLEELDAWGRVLDAMRDARDATERTGARFVVVAFPLLVRDGDAFASRPVDERVLAALRGQGIECIDLGTLLPSGRARELRNSEIDYHPSELGHRLAGEAVARELLARGLDDRASAEAISPSGTRR